MRAGVSSWCTFRIGVVLLCAVSTGACSGMREFKWSEDVQLSDGRTIVVQRSDEARQVADPGTGFRTGWLFQKATILASLPAPVSRDVNWEGDLAPLVLDIQPGDVTYLVCLVSTGSGRIGWHVPGNEFYVAFRLTPQGWQRIGLADLPVSVVPNLIPYAEILIGRGIASGTHVDLDLKRSLMSGFARTDRERTIVRRPNR